MKALRIRRREDGFTLIELLIVVAIIGILAAIAVVNLRGALDRSRQTKTMATMRTVGSAIHAYQMDYSYMPQDGTTGAALKTALGGGAIQVVDVQDAWRHDLVYSTDQHDYTLRSYGNDGAVGPADISRATRDHYENDLVYVDGVFTASPER